MNRNSLNLDTSETQRINGRFCSHPDQEYTCRIRFDRYRLWEGMAIFDVALNLWENGSPEKFITSDGTEIQLRFPSVRIGGDGNETRVLIHKITRTEAGKKYIRTGAVKGLLYFPRQFSLLGSEVEREEVKLIYKGRKKSYFAFRCSYERDITQGQVDKLLLGLSILSNSSLRLSELSNGSEVQLYDNESSKCNIFYYGSGNMYSPITKATVEQLIDEVPWKRLWRFHLALANFIRTKDQVHQLYRGCALLEYLITLFERSKLLATDYYSQPKKKKKLGKSLKLYALMYNIGLPEQQKHYIEEMFPGITFKDFQISKRFEFFELRDAHIHRGELFMTQEQLWQFSRCNVAVNEIIRMLIPHLYKIKEWDYTDKPFYRAIDSWEIVKTRQKLMPWRKIMKDLY